MRLILASGSITRRKLMDTLKVKYEVIKSDYDEDSIKDNPCEYVEELSYNKAIDVKNKVEDDAIIIAADSIIYKDGKKYEKPKSIDEVISNMKEFSGAVSQAITGVTIYDTKQDKVITFSCITDVYLNKLTDEDIMWYVENEEGLLGKAGYSIEGVMSFFVEKIDGDYNNVLGLPVGMMYTKIKELGYSLKDF